jgi:hypothetical protein
MVEKMKLETTSHPNPYRVSWLQKGNQVMVSKKCKVEFKICSSKDEFLCDVIPMDVFHVLLGRPWKYDRNFIHYGIKNTCTLDKSGCRHMLLPLEDKGVKEEAIMSILLMSWKDILEEVKKDQEMQFVVIGKLKSILTITSMNDFSIEIKELLNAFVDIVVDELQRIGQRKYEPVCSTKCAESKEGWWLENVHRF